MPTGDFHGFGHPVRSRFKHLHLNAHGRLRTRWRAALKYRILDRMSTPSISPVNIRSFLRETDDLTHLAFQTEDEHFGVILIPVSWLPGNSDESAVYVDGYDVFKSDSLQS